MEDRRKILEELQGWIGELKKKLSKIGNAALVLSETAEKGSFIPEGIMQAIAIQSSEVCQLQNKIREGYGELRKGSELPVTIGEAEKILADEWESIQKRIEYQSAVAAFLGLRTENPGLRELLQRHKAAAASLALEEVALKECEAAAGKYVTFVAALEETSVVKQVEYIQKLASLFENQLIAACTITKELCMGELGEGTVDGRAETAAENGVEGAEEDEPVDEGAAAQKAELAEEGGSIQTGKTALAGELYKAVTEKAEAKEDMPGAATQTRTTGQPETTEPIEATEQPEAATPPEAATQPEATGQIEASKQPEASEPPEAAAQPEATTQLEVTGQIEASKPPEATEPPEAATQPEATTQLEATEQLEAATPPEATGQIEASKPPEATEPLEAAMQLEATTQLEATEQLETTKQPETATSPEAATLPEATEPPEAATPPESAALESAAAQQALEKGSGEGGYEAETVQEMEERLAAEGVMVHYIPDKEKKEFSAKKFKKEIGGPGEGLRKGILVKAYNRRGIIPELVQDWMDERGDLQKECESLVNKGYLRRYTVKDTWDFYALSGRGAKAFGLASTAQYLGIRPSHLELSEVASGSEAMVRVLLLYAMAQGDKKNENKIGSRKAYQLFADAFHLEYEAEDEKGGFRLFTGSTAGEPLEREEYFDVFREMAVKDGCLEIIVVGEDLTAAARMAENLLAEAGEEAEGKPIYCYGCLEERQEEYRQKKADQEENQQKEAEQEESQQEEADQEEYQQKEADQEEHQEALPSGEGEALGSVAGCQPDSVRAVSVRETFEEMLRDGSLPCAAAYLKAVSTKDPEYIQEYRKFAYAVNDPMEGCSYTSEKMLEIYFQDNPTSGLAEYFMVSALLRNYFLDHFSHDYHMQKLYDTAQSSQILKRDSQLKELLYGLLEFKKQVGSGIDKYADYRGREKALLEKQMAELSKEAGEVYQDRIVSEKASNRRVLETKKRIFSQDGVLYRCLKAVVDQDREKKGEVEAYLSQYFLKEEAVPSVEGIDGKRLDGFLDAHWEEAGHSLRLVKKSSNLKGALRTNIYKKLYRIICLLCHWICLLEESDVDEDDPGFLQYRRDKNSLLENMDAVLAALAAEEKAGKAAVAAQAAEEKAGKAAAAAQARQMGGEEAAGRQVLAYTLRELEARLDGSYQDSVRYFYIGFLGDDGILLNHEYLPDMDSEIRELPGFSMEERVRAHWLNSRLARAEEGQPGSLGWLHAAYQPAPVDWERRLDAIFSGGDNYGSAALILRYLRDTEGRDLSEEYDVKQSISYAESSAERRRDEFIENLELAQSYGQIENTHEDKKERILQLVQKWYANTQETNNFGFFYQILRAFRENIRREAMGRGELLREELEGCQATRPVQERNEVEDDLIKKIGEMIKQQNYTVAEDLLNRLASGDLEPEAGLLEKDYLQEFIDSYDYNYKSVNDVGKMLRALVGRNERARKDVRGGYRLVDNWLANGGSPLGVHKLTELLRALGFAIAQVKEQPRYSGKIETYTVTLVKPQNGRRGNYKHPIAAFGSKAVEDGFRIICLYGTYDADRLVDVFHDIGNAKHTITLLDYPLSSGERRRLARKVKQEASEKIFGVIDRVLLMYLVNNYSETAINRMLMAVMMPYAYYQPYVVSANMMPPEIFIGRREELEKIESATGVNIVYGGRQLGKSALLRMAKNDINGNENHDRAVLVDIKGLDYKKAALKVSQALSDEGVFLQEVETEDWMVLARAMKKRLLQEDRSRIPYLLLLLDEADAFIESCEKVQYQPFDALREVQDVGTDRFKFVVAGLRNIVRFKREVALGHNNVLTKMDSLTVTPFHAREAKELLMLPLSYLGLRFPKEKDSLVSMILATANYFPGLLQMYCQKLLEAMRKGDYAGYGERETPPYEIQEGHIKKVLSEQGFRQEIRDKFMITLRVDEDDYYYIIALLLAYLNHMENSKNAFSPADIVEVARGFGIGRLQGLSEEKVGALMEEMRELNVLRITADRKYFFTRYSFFEMMGTPDQIEDEITGYMEV